MLVTGAVGSGKTSSLRLALRLLGGEGLAVRAVLSEATERLTEGYALGFDACFYEISGDARSSAEPVHRVPLARRSAPESGAGSLRERIKPFAFSSDAFSRAREFLSGPLARADLTAIDEIGPLELRESGGFWPILSDWLLTEKGEILIATVRPALAVELSERLCGPGPERGANGESRPAVITLDGSSVQEAARSIVEKVRLIRSR